MKHLDMRALIKLVESAELLSEAKYHTLFNEATAALLKMVEGNESVAKWATDEIERCKQYITYMTDSIVPRKWLTYFTELLIAHLYVNCAGNSSEGKLVVAAKKKKEKYADFKDLKANDDIIEQHITTLEHFAGINYAPIQNANPEEHRASGFIEYLIAQENSSKETAKQTFIATGSDYRKIIEFPDGYAWVMLDRASCTIEGDAMGHCGNGASRDRNERILSFRKITKTEKGEEHRPSMTFIINRGVLGEMKGRNNNKPDKKYHPYIVELLKSGRVTGIAGGGYKPENNFNLLDLTIEQIEEVVPFLKIPKDYPKVAKIVKDPKSVKNSVLVKLVDRVLDFKMGKYPDLEPSMREIYEMVDMADSKSEQDLHLFDIGKNLKIKNVKFYTPLFVRAGFAASVATRIFGEVVPELEPEIMKDKNGAVEYTKKFYPNGWKAYENYIIENKLPDAAYHYASEVKHKRWPEAEKIIIERGDSFYLFKYIEHVLGKNELWPEAEPLIIETGAVERIVAYALHHKKSRWPEAEKHIKVNRETFNTAMLYVLEFKYLLPNMAAYLLTDPNAVLTYARYTEKRYPEGEPVILTSAEATSKYMSNIIKGEWPEALRTIMSEPAPTDNPDSYYFESMFSTYIGFLKKRNKEFEEVMRKYNKDSIIQKYNEKFGTSL